MFDPTVGRWLTEDPIGFEAGDANKYRYVGNSPTNYTDPFGLERMTVWDRKEAEEQAKRNLEEGRKRLIDWRRQNNLTNNNIGIFFDGWRFEAQDKTAIGTLFSAYSGEKGSLKFL